MDNTFLESDVIVCHMSHMTMNLNFITYTQNYCYPYVTNTDMLSFL